MPVQLLIALILFNLPFPTPYPQIIDHSLTAHPDCGHFSNFSVIHQPAPGRGMCKVLVGWELERSSLEFFDKVFAIWYRITMIIQISRRYSQGFYTMTLHISGRYSQEFYARTSRQLCKIHMIASLLSEPGSRFWLRAGSGIGFQIDSDRNSKNREGKVQTQNDTGFRFLFSPFVTGSGLV